jgi:hypothetical protein
LENICAIFDTSIDAIRDPLLNAIHNVVGLGGIQNSSAFERSNIAAGSWLSNGEANDLQERFIIN